MASIFIEQLEVETVIGVPDEERLNAQVVVLDIEMSLAHERSLQSDAIGDTIDYARVVALVQYELHSQRFRLLERLADHLCRRLSEVFGSPAIRIKIAKTGVVAGARRVGVVVEYRAEPGNRR
ncbi:MAG: dihydroneopterin aldolase [Burkholderiaceae bacterium]